jgi:hypothetical protein
MGDELGLGVVRADFEAYAPTGFIDFNLISRACQYLQSIA